jgi:AcrR family transcriptional regulator
MSRKAIAESSTRYFQEVSVGDNKKSRTRALLLDTAIMVFARQGIDSASILEITEAAGLANASFYYHFRDKAALVEAVGGAVAATLVRETDDAMSHMERGSERVAFGSTFFIRRGVAEPVWGRLIVRAIADLGEFREQISSGIRKDVQMGIDQGEFDVAATPALHAMLFGIVGAAMHDLLEHPEARGTATLACESMLRVLGLPRGRAKALAQRATGWVDEALGQAAVLKSYDERLSSAQIG